MNLNDKLSLVKEIKSKFDMLKIERSDVFDVLVILAHLTFPGQPITFDVQPRSVNTCETFVTIA
jgi:hypothetical protein